jgi:hypothetical protein
MLKELAFPIYSIFDPAAPSNQNGPAPLHSITSSAAASNDGGTSMPSALAVFRLITISNFVGWITGKSRLFAPENPPRVDAGQPIIVRDARSIAHQPAGDDELESLIDRGHGSWLTSNASARCCTMVAKAASMSRSSSARTMEIRCPTARAAASTSLISVLALGMFGFTIITIRRAFGASSRSSAKRFRRFERPQSGPADLKDRCHRRHARHIPNGTCVKSRLRLESSMAGRWLIGLVCRLTAVPERQMLK